MTDLPTAIEAEARAIFEADSSSDTEAAWEYLAPYKRRDWVRIAEIRRERERLAVLPIATGLIAVAPEYGPNAVLIFLDSPPEPRKFQAGERVTVRSGGQP